MVQVVFNSPYQDEISMVDPEVAGLTFISGVPNTVTDEQARVCLTHSFFSVVEEPNRFVPAPVLESPPPPSYDRPPAEVEPEEQATT